MEVSAAFCFYVAGLVWAIELVPQIARTLKRKSTNDISIWWLSLCLTGYGIYAIGTLIIESWPLFWANLLPASLTAIMLYLTLKYRS